MSWSNGSWQVFVALLVVLVLLAWLTRRIWAPIGRWCKGQIADILRPPFATGLAVTQFVSCLFYGAGFATALVRRDANNVLTFYSPARDGFGAVDAKFFARLEPPLFQHFCIFVLMVLFVAGNAWRYYLSFWFVEENSEFKQLRAVRGKWWRGIEWCLRFFALLALYLLVATFANGGRHSDSLIAFVFLMLLGWDHLVYRAAKQSATNAKIDAAKLLDFRGRVNRWRNLEGVGFLASFLYMLAVHFAGLAFMPTIFLVGMLSLVFFVILCIDFRSNWDHYKCLVIPIIAGTCIAAQFTLFFAFGIWKWWGFSAAAVMALLIMGIASAMGKAADSMTGADV